MNEPDRPGEQFVGEAVIPARASGEAPAMARGEPGLPRRFTWRGQEYVVGEVLRRWKESSPCRNGGDERYLRKHWFAIRTTDGRHMTLYFERQARRGSKPTARWWLYTATGQPEGQP